MREQTPGYMDIHILELRSRMNIFEPLRMKDMFEPICLNSNFSARLVYLLSYFPAIPVIERMVAKLDFWTASKYPRRMLCHKWQKKKSVLVISCIARRQRNHFHLFLLVSYFHTLSHQNFPRSCEL